MAVHCEIGELLAQAADDGEARVRLRCPDTPPRCNACAFIKGTSANSTLETALDALGCTIEDVPFMCHQHFDDAGKPVDLCAGWVFARESRGILQSPTRGTLPSAMSPCETVTPDLVNGERSAAVEHKEHRDDSR